MTDSLSELSKIFDSRGPDGLSRTDRERIANYKRNDFLFEKFLKNRKPTDKLQLTHEHILVIGDKSLKKLELKKNEETKKEDDVKIQKEIERLENETELYKSKLKKYFHKQFEEEKISMKKSYEILMQRIEKQRDEYEDERIKEIMRKMNEECEEALKKQWKDAEDIKRRTIEELRELLRKEIYIEMEDFMKNSINEALAKAEEEFKKRESLSIEKTRKECEKESKEKLRETCKRYDESIDKLMLKLKETEDKWKDEQNKRIKLENDFRLLQTDYKRFMNYTQHYNSDYMMKLRHIGAQILEDREFEDKLNEQIEYFELKQFKKNFQKK